MSSGLKSLIVRTIPSITYRGLPLPFNEAPPRRTTVGTLPGFPEFCCTTSPETVPANAAAGLAFMPMTRSFSFTLDIAEVTLERTCVPP